MNRGDIYLADLNLSRGAKQSGIRPVIIVQKNTLQNFTRTVVVVPVIANLKRSQIPGTTVIPAGIGGLDKDSVALCYQITVLDQERLQRQLGTLSSIYILELEAALKYTLELS